MNLRTFHIVAAVAITAQLVLAVWGFVQVGIDGTVPIHWNASGEVDGYGPAWLSFLLAPVVSIGITALFGVIPRVEPRRENLRRSATAYRQLGIAVIGLFTLVQAGVVLASTGHDVPVALLVGFGCGVLFMVLGNQLGTVRPNYMFGIRTPWTLTSDLSWAKTHRLMGRMFFLSGLGMVLLALLGNATLLFAGLMAFLAITLVVGFVYSYRVWKADPDKRIQGGDAA